MIHRARARSERIRLHAKVLQQGDEEIAEWCVVVGLERVMLAVL
jgi:hypothetical protein